jgi:SMI1/KNR4 family protein SUKH-1
MAEHFRLFLQKAEPTAQLIGLLRRHTGKGVNELRQAIVTQQPILDEKVHHNAYAEYCTRVAELVNEVEARAIPYTLELDGMRASLQELLNELQGWRDLVDRDQVDDRPEVRRLIDAPDGGAAYDAFQSLAQLAKDGDGPALAMLINYARWGKYNHIREFIVSELAHFTPELAHSAPHREAVTGARVAAAPLSHQPLDRHAATILLPFFKEGLGHPVRGYWSILGYIRVAGPDAYRDLVGLVLDSRLPSQQRAHAAKCLAQYSRQRFDREAPSDPGYWSEQHIRTTEIRAWLDAGCPTGVGYPEPTRHPALDSPKTDFERLVARLDKKLAKDREQRQDPANPTSWLTPASPRHLEEIKARWRLPPVYLDFLTRFSPLGVTIDGAIFVQIFNLFGAADLIAGQDGYSESSVLKRRLDEWPPYLLVIGIDGGDPYVLDLSHADSDDAPVLSAIHGQGSWNFEPAADSFREFIESLVE